MHVQLIKFRQILEYILYEILRRATKIATESSRQDTLRTTTAGDIMHWLNKFHQKIMRDSWYGTLHMWISSHEYSVLVWCVCTYNVPTYLEATNIFRQVYLRLIHNHNIIIIL